MYNVCIDKFSTSLIERHPSILKSKSFFTESDFLIGFRCSEINLTMTDCRCGSQDVRT
jgi:hypothetical protein